MTATAVPAKSGDAAGAPAKAKAVLGTLIIVAAVANLPLAMANVALPSIGAYFDATQTQLNLVAVAYSLGLACSAPLARGAGRPLRAQNDGRPRRGAGDTGRAR